MGHSQLQEVRRLTALTQNALVKFHLKHRRRAPGQVDELLLGAWNDVETAFAELCAGIDQDKAIAARVATLGAAYVQEITKINTDNYSRRVTCVGTFLDGVKAELETPNKAA